MFVNGTPYRTIWPTSDGAVEIIDQTKLPHEFVTVRLESMRDAERAIRDMQVRGAPLIGVTAAYGVALSMRHHASDAALQATCDMLLAARPTAVNLRWGVERMRVFLAPLPASERAEAAWKEAACIAEEDVAINAAIGRHGAELIRAMQETKQRAGRSGTVNVLTHCNAGWLATVDWGTALAPIYKAFDAGIPLHVWVDETRPRNQGASLTAWELGQHGVPHTVIVDNAGGHLMQHGLVDMAIVGCDRVTARGDVCNKIGTYLKALAAHDNNVPLYVALPTPTIDWTLQDGVQEIPIEERGAEEVTHVAGLAEDGQVRTVRITPQGSHVANYGFDVTPARLVTALITERGVVAANAEAMRALLPSPLRGEGEMNENELRSELLRIANKLDAQGLNRGTSGNVSVRCGEGLLITPSGLGAEGLGEDDLVYVDFSGQSRGRWQPSSEWLFHRDILAQRPEFGAVIHTHSIAATSLACLRKDIPPFHYMIVLAGGDSIRCAGYATFGTQALSDAALLALRERKACLLANHGMIAAGADLAEAFRIAVEVETLCELYLRALQVGQPVLLTADEFQAAQDRFSSYGKPVR